MSESTSEELGIDPDDLFSALAHAHRRRVLGYLQAHDHVASVDELAAAVVEVDPGVADRRAVEIGLHHEHLPMLADREFVEYDPDAGVVRATPRVEDVGSFLAGTGDPEGPDAPGGGPAAP